MNLIMIDHADKAWIKAFRDPAEMSFDNEIERRARNAIIGIVGMFLGVVLMLCALVLALNSPKAIAEVDDCALSPDMQSYIETSKPGVIIKNEDIE